MQLKAKVSFSWAHRGVNIEEFAKGQLIDTDDEDLIAVALNEGWAEKAKAPTKAEQKKEIEVEIASLESALVDAKDGEEAEIEAALSAARLRLSEFSK